MTNQPLVSIIIPAYNCEKIISRTIQAVLDQTYPKIEIIIVDDGSSDGTANVLRSFMPVRSIFQANAGPASARNRGAKVAQGEFLFFTDSDCIPENNWIEIALKPFVDQGVGVVAGSYAIANPESGLARGIHAEILYRHQHLMPQYPKAFGSYNFGIRQKVFVQIGGFNEGYRCASGEDNDLSYKVVKAGYKIYFEKDSLVAHFHTTRIFKYLLEQKRHGFWRVKMYVDHPEMIRGDDYTFWKDMVEVPLSFVSLAMVPLLFLLGGVKVFVFLTGVLGLIQLYFGMRWMRDVFDAFFYAFVMFLRAFFRMFGFSSGILYYLFLNRKKKSK